MGSVPGEAGARKRQTADAGRMERSPQPSVVLAFCCPSLLSTRLPLPLRLSQQTRHMRTGLHSVLLRHCALALGQLADGQRHVSIVRHLQGNAWGQQPRWQRWQVRPCACTPSLGGMSGDAQVQVWRAVPLPEAAGFSCSCQPDVQECRAAHPGWSLSQAWYAHAYLEHES